MSDQVTNEGAEPNGQIVDNHGKDIPLEKAIDKADGKKEEEPAPRPEWLPERFKSPEDLAKSYTELEKTLKEKGKVAPDAYEIDPDVGVDTEAEDFKGLVEMAKSTNMTNAQVNAVLKFAKESGYIASGPSFEEEMAKLGSDKDKILDGLSAFASTKLTNDEKAVLEGMTYTADQTKLLYKLIRMHSSIPAKPGDSVVEGKEDLQRSLDKLLSDPTIRSDRGKQKDAEAIAARIASMK